MNIQITHVTAERREEWNALVAQVPPAALLQSWEWGEFKERLGWRAYRVAAEAGGRLVAGAQLLIRPGPLSLASIAYIPRGPAGAWQEPGIGTPLFAELHRVARRHRALFLKVEPAWLAGGAAAASMRAWGFRASSYSNQPRATVVVDLQPEPDEIFARFSASTRRNIRLGPKKGLALRAGGPEDLETFYDLIKITAQRGGFAARSLDYYRSEWDIFAPRGQMRFLLATYAGATVAACICVTAGKFGLTLHSASSGAHANLKPNHLLRWESIRWARERGATAYDMWGIPDEVGLAVHAGQGLPESERTDGLWGVYGFKRGFSEDVVLYDCAYDYPYVPGLRAIMSGELTGGSVLDRAAAWADGLRRG